jgi:hypothetical protein
LSHDELNIFILQTFGVHFLSVVIVVIFLGIFVVNSLALAVVVGVVVARMIVSSMIVRLCSC